MKASLSILSFVDRACGVISKELSPIPKSARFPPVLSSRSFIVLRFTLRFLTHLELMFAKAVRSVSRFIFLPVDIQSLQLHMMKRPSLLHCVISAPLPKTGCLYLSGASPGSLQHQQWPWCRFWTLGDDDVSMWVQQQIVTNVPSGGGRREISVPYSQFCCEPQTALKSNVY